MRLFIFLFRLFFHLLYHEFAWTYDLVALTVSLGRWTSWVKTILPFVHGRVLEVGFGPGHLQVDLQSGKETPFGLDESRQMARQASRNLRRQRMPVRLARGVAQELPYRNASFDCIAATFPTEYIFRPETLHEMYRVLIPGGRLVMIPAAWITGNSVIERMAAWLFRVTGQAGALEKILPSIKASMRYGGFEARHEIINLKGSKVLIIIAEKQME